MKKSKRLLIGVLILGILATGCAKGSDKDAEEAEKKEAQKLEIQDQKEEDTGDDEAKSETDETEEGAKKVLIYFPNEDVDGFDTEEMELPEVTAENLIAALVEKGVIPADVEAISCKEVKVDDEDALELDLNDAFRTYIQSMGTAGEYASIGSLCNTFLSAYDCEKIQITVEGETLETGHAEYPGYMSAFE